MKFTQRKYMTTKQVSAVLLTIMELFFTYLLITDAIDVYKFLAISGLWFFLCSIFIIGFDSITEITAWKLSIKRDLRAVKRERKEIEQISRQLNEVTKLSAENAYILASTGMLAMIGDTERGDGNAKKRLENNLDTLSKYFAPDEEENEKWWDDVVELFAHRKTK